MTKNELVDVVAVEANISKAAAARALDAAIGGIQTAVAKGETVRLVGFGTFDISSRKARTGRNPKTKEAIEIPASKAPRFRPGSTFKAAVQ